MGKTFERKIYGPARKTLEDFQFAAQAVTDASRAQTVLMVALTAVSVAALLVAVIAVRRVPYANAR